jgi:hypothetical protein
MAKRRNAKNPENDQEKASRIRLQKLLKLAQKFLTQVHLSSINQVSRLSQVARESLTILWTDANQKMIRVDQSLRRDLSKGRRNTLRSVGLFEQELEAKAALFEFLLDEKKFVNGLKLLGSIVRSLSKVFPVMSAVKEFIDAILSMREFLSDPEFTTLGDIA